MRNHAFRLPKTNSGRAGHKKKQGSTRRIFFRSLGQKRSWRGFGNMLCMLQDADLLCLLVEADYCVFARLPWRLVQFLQVTMLFLPLWRRRVINITSTDLDNTFLSNHSFSRNCCCMTFTEAQALRSVKAASNRIRLRLTIRLMANGSLHTSSVGRIRVNFLSFDRLPAYLKLF